MAVRAVRGATQVIDDDRELILDATKELLGAIMAENGFAEEELISIFFSMTDDLRAVAPALAARQMGWLEPALLCVQELGIDGTLPRTIRVLAHVETDTARTDIVNVYLNGTDVLRDSPKG